jgi:hypothetical protein
MAAWPGSLPQYMEVGASETKQNTFIRSNPSIGPPKMRRRFSASTRTITGTMLFSASDRATFDTFYDTTLVDGSDAFTFTDPVDLTTQNFRFVEPPKFEYLVGGVSGAGQQRVTLVLERLP